ncbi:hypothetical protein COU78_04065 [Candidatus Peregrinibacteria bacterium CG10_big_fil_rev_8_21_14_0_10_49_24]|nr:MAG: hypothetical protein COV83_00595 [Candidatus Peregrinibacteria bacterium CG11_big_fil_rev_8_21_14_0_20_49_14]PIR50844.1 MAG: hypothetical protein COU78_04065 [Candidatus Peregrinibacteria bacterium CG10_big_fil_rev_8_21_14_0_10_49_24]PJA67121.1 MAG: hypothetical protein CO157_05995 [Candidatus Peregrinibacteria bacterium CG_4_9_14_3_um_filter_49_12]
MHQTCSQCSASFEITEDDLAFYDKISPVIGAKKYGIAPPKLCPDCRAQRRLVFRNQQTIYKRKCNASGKPIISIYSADKPQNVYSPEEWWGDAWDALSYAQTYDFEKSFNEQFTELMRAVPHISVLVSNVQNSEYTNQTYDSRDCYLSSAIKDCNGVLYCQNANKVTDSMDSSFCFESELLYESTDSYGCYGCTHAEHCYNCSDCSFVFDCIGCQHCFGCIGLRQQKYHFFNQPCSPEDYKQKVEAYALHTWEGLEKARNDMTDFLQDTPHESTFLRNSENVTGNNIQNSRNCKECYDALDLEDCRYSSWIFSCKDAVDCYGMGESQVVYDCIGVEEVQMIAFSFGTTGSQNCYYTDLCFNCHDCFGCVGLRNKEYCILNTQYSKKDYEDLVPRIIAHMQETDEWGEFFKPSVSAFDYNESKASELFPLTKEEAQAKGFTWKDNIDEPPQATKAIPAERLPSNIGDIPDDVLNWALHCSETGRPYKITKKELEFYRQRQLPVPRLHPDLRLKKRSLWR